MEARICRNCGNPQLKQDGNLLKCEYCGSVYHNEREQKVHEKLRDMLDDLKWENLKNLRQQLYGYIHGDTINSEAIVETCRDIRHLIPDDFIAGFYEAAHSGNKQELAEFINKIDVNENYPFIENAIRYIIKELDHPLLLPACNLIERAAQARVIDLRLKNDLQSLLETEAAKVQSELFNPNITRDFFIMYSGKDIDKVMELVAFIESQNFTCFVAQRNIRHGRGSQQEYTSILKTAMDNCECLVFVSSVNSRDNACQALSVEMDYIKREDKDNAPPEMRNMRYTKIPYKYKKRRIEYLIDVYDGRNRYGEDVVKEFFYGLEYVQDDPYNVLKRYRELEDIINGKGTADTGKGPITGEDRKPQNPVAAEAKEAFEHKDYIAAAELFEEAANMGDAASLCNLGYCYEVGLGVDRDTKMAVDCYRRAANAGSARAQYNLGVCYALGAGVSEDFDQAVEYMNKAAKNGDQKAQKWLKSNG